MSESRRTLEREILAHEGILSLKTKQKLGQRNSDVGGSGAAPLWLVAAETFILSLVLIGLRELTGGLWASILVHMAKNGVAFLYIFIRISE